MIIRETYLQRIIPFMKTDVIKVMTGIRRSGKSESSPECWCKFPFPVEGA